MMKDAEASRLSKKDGNGQIITSSCNVGYLEFQRAIETAHQSLWDVPDVNSLREQSSDMIQ